MTGEIIHTDYHVYNALDRLVGTFSDEQSAKEYAQRRCSMLGALTVAKVTQHRSDIQEYQFDETE